MSIKTEIYSISRNNKDKYNYLIDINELSIGYRTMMSEFIFEHLSELVYSTVRKYSTKHWKEVLSYIKDSPLSNWTLQTMFNDMITLYKNKLDKHIDNHPFFCTDGINISVYKKNTKHHTKGDLKELTLNKKKPSELVSLLNYLRYVNPNNYDTLTNKKIKERYQHYCDKYGKDRINNLLILHTSNIAKRITKINIQSGTYTLSHCENGKTIKSEFIKDENNSMYKDWFKLCFRKKDIYVPLSINEKYHHSNRLDTVYKVKVNDKNKITVLTFYEAEEPKYKEFNDVVGIDLNIKHNFCSLSDDKVFDYDRKWIHQLVDFLKSIDQMNSMTDKHKKQLSKICRRNEWYFKSLISEILDFIEQQNITDIVMEDLDTFGASFVKSDEFDIKYSRLARLLHLSNIKNIIKQQATNRGIRVHLTPASYTSQQCPVCGYISKDNRLEQETFECVNCGHKDNADHNASINIRNRYINVLYKNSIHKVDAYSCLVPKLNYCKKDILKNILESSFKPCIVQSLGLRHSSDIIKET